MTRVLLDTNILIHREASTPVRDDIGVLFRWLDQLKYEKIVHPDSLDEVGKHADPTVVRAFERKLQSYTALKTRAADTQGIADLRNDDQSANDRVDTSLLAEVAGNRVDMLISEDRGIHRKAARLGLANRVFTIETFLEKVTAENPSLADYKVLSVKKVFFGNLDVRESFFDSFRSDYTEFDSWFNQKADEVAYVCRSESGTVLAFLYLKREGPSENYSDILPTFAPADRLKIGTFKVVANGFKLGERFLKIVFDNALKIGVAEIYVTAFRKTIDQDRLLRMLEDWGFTFHGFKKGAENVYVRDFRPKVDLHDPQKTFPYIARTARKFIVPIRPEYHTELLPDSILNNEPRKNFVENKPNRNALSKVYISRSIERGLRAGDIIVFYRTQSGSSPAYHTSVATTIGVVQAVTQKIADFEAFVALCRKRSVFSEEELRTWWDAKPSSRPFVVNFLYIYSLPKRPTLRKLDEIGMVQVGKPPRGFMRITDDSFEKLLEVSDAHTRFIVP